MPQQGVLTLCIGALTATIPLIVLQISVALAQPGPVACVRCDADVPRSAEKCPNCGTLSLDRHQTL
jgi:predicted amidophosphoribosyltransferase